MYKRRRERERERRASARGGEREREEHEPIVTFFNKQESSKTEISQTPALKSVFCLSGPISQNLPLTTLFLDKLLAWTVNGTSINNGPTSYPLKIRMTLIYELQNRFSKFYYMKIIGKGSTRNINELQKN